MRSPVSLAYATLAGLPPHYGIYCYLVGGLAFLFGTSKQLAIGPTSAISMPVGTSLVDMAGGDPQRAAEIAALTALVFAVCTVLAWALPATELQALLNRIIKRIMKFLTRKSYLTFTDAARIMWGSVGAGAVSLAVLISSYRRAQRLDAAHGPSADGSGT